MILRYFGPKDWWDPLQMWWSGRSYEKLIQFSPLRAAYFNDKGQGWDRNLKCWNTLRRNQGDQDDKEDIY